MVLLQVHQRLIEETKHVAGAKVENNKFCVSVHFRCVDEKVGDGTERKWALPPRMAAAFLPIYSFIPPHHPYSFT